MTSDGYGRLSINVTRFLTNYLVRFLFAGLVLYCCWVPLQNVGNWFSWHVILCTFGYIPLMAESIMLFTGDEIWSRQVSRKTQYAIHGVLITLGTIFVVVGNSLVFHYVSPGYHLTSVHGQTGLASMVFLIFSIGLGVAAKQSDELKRFMRPVWTKFIHNIIGLVAYAVGIVSLCYGFYTHYFVFYTSHESRLAAVIITIGGFLWSINGALVSAYNQMKSIVT